MAIGLERVAWRRYGLYSEGQGRNEMSENSRIMRANKAKEVLWTRPLFMNMIDSY